MNKKLLRLTFWFWNDESWEKLDALKYQASYQHGRWNFN